MKEKTNYDQFHKQTSAQHRIITKDNFTYRNVLRILDCYLASKMKALDLGCGSGALSFYMALQGNKVIGVDISRRVIDMCNESIEYLNLPIEPSFLTGDFMMIELKTKFNLVLCSEVIEHLEDDQGVIHKIHTHLKPSGILIVSAPSKNAPLYRLGFAKNFDKRVGHLRRYTLDNLVALCKNTGFQILETRKTEGILRNFLFLSHFGNLPLRVANRLSVFGDIIAFLDNVLLKLFGESQVFVVARKP